jgi:hypothetical protein
MPMTGRHIWLDGVSDPQPGGAQGSANRTTLRTRPTVNTNFDPISSPGESDIIEKEFRGK